jgi:hypothetical protein
MNISKEFQLLEAFAVSLDYAVQAEDLFVKHAPGSRDHGFCLLQKASVLSQMQKSGESLKALQQALNSKHSEVLSRAQLMADQSGVPLISEDSLQLREDSGQRVLGELEGKLVALLAEGPKDKAVLMKALYGEKICSQARENRFKNLMSRVRAKLPGLVVLKNSNYEIIDVSAIGDKLISQRSAN